VKFVCDSEKRKLANQKQDGVCGEMFEMWNGEKIKIKFQNRKQNIVERSFLQECIYSAGYHGEAIPELNI
jgi:hypothetical protein